MALALPWHLGGAFELQKVSAFTAGALLPSAQSGLFVTTHLIDSLVEVPGNVKGMEHVDCIDAHVGDHFEKRLPHVAAKCLHSSKDTRVMGLQLFVNVAKRGLGAAHSNMQQVALTRVDVRLVAIEKWCDGFHDKTRKLLHVTEKCLNVELTGEHGVVWLFVTSSNVRIRHSQTFFAQQTERVSPRKAHTHLQVGAKAVRNQTEPNEVRQPVEGSPDGVVQRINTCRRPSATRYAGLFLGAAATAQAIRTTGCQIYQIFTQILPRNHFFSLRDSIAGNTYSSITWRP